MKWLKPLLILALLALTSGPVFGASAKVIKVLPSLLDDHGRNTLSPSLYERDAYQAKLRKDNDKVSTVRFDVNWKAGSVDRDNIRIRVEVRGDQGNQPVVIEEKFKPGFWGSTWSQLTLPKETYKQIREVAAWRVTIWNGEEKLAEQKSFLW